MGILQKKRYNKGKKLVIQYMKSGYPDIARAFLFYRAKNGGCRARKRAARQATALSFMG